MEDLGDKNVLVMGLGLHGGGVAAARFFADAGATVTVTDLRDEHTLRGSRAALGDRPIHYVFGEHREEDFLQADIVIKNPGVPPDSPLLDIARKADATVTSDAAWFLEHTKAFVIGVTGTKGKTTTASLINSILDAHDVDSMLVSTPGGPGFFDALTEKPAVCVAEFSSWDLETIDVVKKSPAVSVFTNLFPDHLNRHKTMEAYGHAKANIFAFQLPDDVVLFPAADQRVSELVAAAPAKNISITQKDIESLPALQLAGEHMRTLAALAMQAAHAALEHPVFPLQVSFDTKLTRETLKQFSGLPGRLQQLGEWQGRVVINDTTATNPTAATAALSAIDGPIVLIAGGEGKGLDVEPLADAIVEHVTFLALLPGSGTDALRSALHTRGFTALTRDTIDMEDAFTQAWEASSAGDTILLSPGASSLNRYVNEFARGEAFADAFHAVQKT